MQLNCPVKDRLHLRLKVIELQMIKQALFAYLAKHDPDVKKTKFTNTLLDKVLPHLKEVSPSWESMTVELLNTSHNAINQYYHCLRGAFKGLPSLRNSVVEYIASEKAAAEMDAQIAAESEHKGENTKLSADQFSDLSIKQNQEDETQILGKRANPEPEKPLDIKEESSPAKQQPLLINSISITDLVKSSPYYQEYADTCLVLKKQKVDLRATEIVVQDLMSKIMGQPNPF